MAITIIEGFNDSISGIRLTRENPPGPPPSPEQPGALNRPPYGLDRELALNRAFFNSRVNRSEASNFQFTVTPPYRSSSQNEERLPATTFGQSSTPRQTHGNATSSAEEGARVQNESSFANGAQETGKQGDFSSSS